MTTIYHGWTESETQTALRAENRKAREIAFAVWNASQITDEEAEALQKALDSVRGDTLFNLELDKRAHDIEYALNDEPLTKEQALSMLDELGEITTAQIRDGVSSQKWFDAQPERSL